MKRLTLMAALLLATVGCGEGLGQDNRDDFGAAMDDALASGAEAEGVVARRLYSGEDIYAPWISTFSRDGRYQTFTYWGHHGDVAIRELATGAIRYVTDGEAEGRRGFAMGMRFSTDGSRVAFGWWRDDRYVLNVVGVDGSDLRTVFDPRERDADEVVVYDWSPDDSEILLGVVTWEKRTASGWEGLGYELVVVSVADGSAEVLLPFNAEGRIPYSRAFFSPDGGLVAYSTVREGSDGLHDIVVLERESGRRTPVLGGPAEEQVLGWSSDGGHLWALSGRGGSPSVWALPVREGEAVGPPILVRGDVYGFISGHVVDDRLLYHVVSEAPELFVADVDPTTGRLLSEPSKVEPAGSFWDGDLATWSPDGQSLAYVRGNPERVVVRAARNGNHVQVFDLPSGYTGVYSLRWSPDSRSIQLSGRMVGTAGTSRMLTLRLGSGQFEPGPINAAEGRPVTHDLRTVFKTDGGGIEYISLVGPDKGYLFEAPEPPGPPSPDGCAWGGGGIALSPSDDRLVFTTNTPQGSCVGVIPTEGGAIDWIYRDRAGGRLAGPQWSVDGSSLFFGRRARPSTLGEVWTVPVTGGQARKVFEYEGLNSYAVHPDGDRLVFRAGEESYELWVMEGLEEAIGGR